jgi:hypothetical protein
MTAGCRRYQKQYSKLDESVDRSAMGVFVLFSSPEFFSNLRSVLKKIKTDQVMEEQESFCQDSRITHAKTRGFVLEAILISLPLVLRLLSMKVM